MRAAVALLALSAFACDGVGRPIVGRTAEGDGGAPRSCEASPSCRAPRTLAADHFEVPHAPPELLDGDCDEDLVDDTVDNCLGVPNPTQGPTDCDNARSACERLAMGSPSLQGADLRGCRLEAPVALSGSLSLRGADLRCADVTFVAEDGASVDLTDTVVTASRLRIEAVRPVSVDTSRTTFTNSALALDGAARLVADSAIFEGSTLLIDPAGGVVVSGDGAAAVDIARSNFTQSTIWEAPSSQPGVIRLDGSTLTASAVDVRVLDLHRADVASSRIAAETLDAFEADVTVSQLRTARGSFASSTLNDVVFASCESLHLSDCEVAGSDFPLCPPEGLRTFRTELDGCTVAGGAELVQSQFFAGVIGGGEASTLVTRDSTVDGVRFCDLGAAAFRRGEIRCTHCGYDSFMGGAAVCVSGATLTERGCPAIELAPECE